MNPGALASTVTTWLPSGDRIVDRNQVKCIGDLAQTESSQRMEHSVVPGALDVKEHRQVRLQDTRDRDRAGIW